MKETGGPAFPVAKNINNASNRDNTRSINGTEGMTLRDYFAAKALNGYLSAMDTGWSFDELGYACYKIADAMIEARSK